MLRVLVFGAGGFVGRALVRHLRDLGVAVDAPRSAQVDVTDASAVRAAVHGLRPGCVASLAAANPGAPDAAGMLAINGEGAANVARASAEAGARLVHLSSDMVLDGEHAPYGDDAPPSPTEDYGRSKAAGEEAVLSLHPGALVVRTSLVFDPAEMDRATRGLADRLAAGEPCRLFSDEVRSPVARRTLVAALAELCGSRVTGRLNVAGTTAHTREAIGRALLAHFRVPGLDRVETCTAAEVAPGRPRDLTLDVSRAAGLLRTPLRSFREEGMVT